MPLVMNIIDALTKNKPAGSTYFVMWCRTFDHSLLVIDNPMTLAVEAGFSGERALSTWKDRMRSLVELGFIDAKEGSAGPFHYVLLLNPHKVVWQLKGRIQEGTFRQLQTRANWLTCPQYRVAAKNQKRKRNAGNGMQMKREPYEQETMGKRQL
jgi:hypothetical protein